MIFNFDYKGAWGANIPEGVGIYIYLTILFFPALMSLFVTNKNNIFFYPIWFFYIFFVIILLGATQEIGIDYMLSASTHIKYAQFDLKAIAGILFAQDSMYHFLSWVLTRNGIDFSILLLICIAILMLGVSKFALYHRDSWLILFLTIPTLVLIFGINYPRQGAAMGLFLVFLTYLFENKVYKAIFFFLLAVSFHRSIIVFFPIFLVFTKITYFRVFFFIFFSFLIIFLFKNIFLELAEKYFGGHLHYFIGWATTLNPGVDPNLSWNTSYRVAEDGQVTYGNQSIGALIRIVYIIFPISLCLFFYKRLDLTKNEIVYFSISFIALFLLVLLSFRLSTVADRLAYYFIPIQFLAFVRLLDLASNNLGKIIVQIFLIFLCCSQFLIWYSQSCHAGAWRKYDNIFIPSIIKEKIFIESYQPYVIFYCG